MFLPKLFLLSVLYCFLSYPALEKNSLIHTPKGTIHIGVLSPNDLVTSQFGDLCVVQNTKKYVEELFIIELENESLCVSADQLFYDVQLEKWIPAQSLSVASVLQNIHNKAVRCIKIGRSTSVVEMYDLSLTYPHTFFIGKTGILTHNVVIAVLPAIAPTVATISKIGALIAGVIGIVLKHNSEHKQKKYAHVQDYVIPASSGGPDDDHKKHPYGKYHDASYHHKNNSGSKSVAPKNGQKALDNSVPVSCDTPRRVAISDGEIVILDQTRFGLYHGHVRTWIELKKAGTAGQKIINALIKNGLVNSRGKFLC